MEPEKEEGCKRLDKDDQQKQEAEEPATAEPARESPYSTAQYIEDIHTVKYPEGVKGPEPQLNENSTARHFRYDRHFLLQFSGFCKDKPPKMVRLEALGLEPPDPMRLTRTHAPRSYQRTSLPAILAQHSPVALGIGGGPTFGLATPTNVDGTGNIGISSNLTSDERFAMASASNQRSAHASGTPFVAGPPTQGTGQTQGGQIRKRTRSKRGDVQVKALLDELTLGNFDSASDKLIARANKSEPDARSMIQVIRLLLEKAMDEPAKSEIYARLCSKMYKRLGPNGIRNAEGKRTDGGQLFREYLLQRCRASFDQGHAGMGPGTANAVASTTSEHGTENASKLDPHRDPAVQGAKFQNLVNFMSELFRVGLLTESIIHESVKKCLGQCDLENPEEEKLESLCILLTNVGALLDTPKARLQMDDYFSQIREVAHRLDLSPRMQFMLQDLAELRENEPSTAHTGEAIPENGPSTSPQTRAEVRVLNSPELTAMIFSFLPERPNSDVGIGVVSDRIPTFEGQKWRSFFANLATVNWAFFHASIAILWETMDTLEPLFELILPCDTIQDSTTPLVPLTYWATISSEDWKRFETYSSRTKTLVLNRKTSPEVDLSWLFYIANSNKRPTQLFPAVKNLFLTSNDTLSLFIAFHVAPQLDILCINLDEESHEPDNDSTVALACSVAENAGKLTSFRLVHPTSSRITMDVARISSLTSLYLRIHNGTSSEDLACLNELTSLQVLRIHQRATESALSAAFPEAVGTADAIAQASEMEKVTDLSVRANCTKQFQVATQLSLNSLRSLELEVLPDMTGSMAVLPLFLMIHFRRNPGLTSLDVTCSNFKIIKAEWVENLRGDSRYTMMEPFLNALSSLRHLTALSIDEASFLAVDIIVQMLQILPKLPQLQVFRFTPRPMTKLEADDLLMPPIGALEEVSLHNPNLRELAIPLDINTLDSIVISHGYLSNHGLKKLAIYTFFWDDDEEIEIATDDGLRVARYLDRLFPSLETLTEEWEMDTWEWRTWSAIERMLSFCQEIRAQALNDVRLMGS
ncbi:hypothetical protein MD484_g6881, partial [Candolleomyces efflorescens]